MCVDVHICIAKMGRAEDWFWLQAGCVSIYGTIVALHCHWAQKDRTDPSVGRSRVRESHWAKPHENGST